MKKLKGFIGKIAIVFCMTLMFGILGSSNVKAASTTWDVNNKDSQITLTNNNLTAERTGTRGDGSTVRSNNPIETNKKVYWEVKIEARGYTTIGISSNDFPLDACYFLPEYTKVGSAKGYEGWNGVKADRINGQSSYGDAYTTGDIIGIAVDRVNNTITFYKNGISQGIAFTDINSMPNIYPTVAFVGPGKVTANFGATPFSYDVPSGYLPYGQSNVITLNKSTDILPVGQTDTLTAAVTPDDTTNKNIAWKSSDESIATVDENGKVTAVKEGTATITATTTDGSNLSASCVITVTSQTPPVTQGIVLNVEPEKSKIKLNETVSANLTIDNIKDIAAEDVRIKYDNTKLQFLGMDEVDGIKLVKSDNSQPGELRLILASKGSANVVEAKKALLKLNFQGIAAGDALVDVTKGRVSDGIEMEKDLTDDQCGQATITIDNEALVDVNKDGQFTLLDLAIDGRHYSEDPATLTQYNTDIVVNKAIDDDDLTKIGEYMLANPNYKF